MSNIPQNEKKRLTLFGVEAVYLYLLGICFAFVGWIAENAARFIVLGIIDCRFHLLPFISPYALIPFALHLVLGDPDELSFFGKGLIPDTVKHKKLISNIVGFLTICLTVFLGELVIGNLWDILFGVKLWDYSSLPFSVTPYAGLVPTLGYGGGAYIIFKLIYKPLLNLMKKRISFKAAKIICLTLGVLIVLDTCAMMIYSAVLGHGPMYWRIEF